MQEAEVSGFHFHDLRHCAVTNLRRAEVDITTAMQIVGHTSLQMWKRCNQVNERDLTQAANKLGKYLRTDTLLTLTDIRSDGSDVTYLNSLQRLA